ncbi:uncharacterized protein SCHCODRAFT_02610406, partial [Schizophyllum commune H4-8]|uniref:uncharacterized protein n=1 Tax=Schizophyllum commune (strain H4-8 / FGSC 9210) TaxID=578458 RepID=UPI00215E4900
LLHGMDGTGEGAMLAWSRAGGLLCTTPLLHNLLARAFFARSVACHCLLVWTCDAKVLRN